MSDLQQAQQNIHGAYGAWGTNELAEACRAGAAVAGFGGDAQTVGDIGRNILKVSELTDKALEGLREVAWNKAISDTWVGDTHVAAAEAGRAMFTDIYEINYWTPKVQRYFDDLADSMERWTKDDLTSADTLNDVAAEAERMTTWGFMPDLGEYDSEKMSDIHYQAMNAIDTRVNAHDNVRWSGQELAKALRQHATRARARAMAGAPMSELDQVTIAEAGNSAHFMDDGILTQAQETQAAAAMNGLSPADRQTMMGLLASSQSDAQRAYLLRHLAEGHSLAEVVALDNEMAAHGDDPNWMYDNLGGTNEAVQVTDRGY